MRPNGESTPIGCMKDSAGGEKLDMDDGDSRTASGHAAETKITAIGADDEVQRIAQKARSWTALHGLDRKQMAAMSRIATQSLGRAILDLAIPPNCLGCDAPVTENGTLCAECWLQLRFITRPYCEVLGHPFAYDLGEGAVSAAALADPPPFEKARAAVLYDEVARRLVARLKYEDRPDLAEPMALWMARAADDLIKDNPIIMPVPLHRWRLLRRRYNQSALLSRILATHLQLDHQPLAMIRLRATQRQVGLSRRARQDNVRGAFRVTPVGAQRISKRPVILVDDVFTTGATMSAAARACLRAGASSVRVLTFASVTDALGAIPQGDMADLEPIDL